MNNLKKIITGAIGGAITGTAVALVIYTSIKTVNNFLYKENNDPINKEELIKTVEYGAGIGILLSFIDDGHEIIIPM